MLDFNNIGVSEQAEELYLSQDPGRIRDVLKDIIDLFDCDSLPDVCVYG